MFQRSSGFLLHISSLPSQYGIGDLGPNAFAFADMLQRTAQSYWQVLPLNPTRITNGNSPYFSSSSIAGNPLLISPDVLLKLRLLDQTDIPTSTFSEQKVNFAEVVPLKKHLLETAWKRYKEQGDSEHFKKFCDTEKNWLDDFTLFITLKNVFNDLPWNQWPESVKRRQPLTLQNVIDQYHNEIEREKWYQYLFWEQWSYLKHYCNERSIRIIGDLPIYVSYDSADVWTCPDMFKLDNNLEPVAVSGVPPDYFSATGQLWSNPVYKWGNHRLTGFSWWIQRMKKLLDQFDIVRIDHFRGLVQYWEVPAGEATAINGSWQDVPTYELLDALIKNNQPFPVIAEDLGLITNDVRAAINHYGFPSMKVLQFAFGGENSHNPYLPHEYTQNCVVYTGTHDNNTTKGWFEKEATTTQKERFCKYIGREIFGDECIWEMIRLAQSSVAGCAIIPLQDLLLLGSEARMNQPGILEGNWDWRFSSEQFKRLPIDRIAEMVKNYGRAPNGL